MIRQGFAVDFAWQDRGQALVDASTGTGLEVRGVGGVPDPAFARGTPSVEPLAAGNPIAQGNDPATEFRRDGKSDGVVRQRVDLKPTRFSLRVTDGHG